MQVTRTLQLSAAATALFLLLIIVSIFLTTRSVDEAIRKGRSADTIVKAVFDLNAFTDEYLAHPGERIVEQWKATHDHIGQILASEIGDTEESRRLINELHKTNESIAFVFENSTGRTNSRSLPALTEHEAAQLKIKAQSMVADATRLAALNFEAQESTRMLADRIQVGLTLLFSIGALATLAILYRNITRPLATLLQGTERIAGGDLAYRLDIQKKDEFGEVAHSFNEMAQRLEELYQSLDKRVWAAEEVVKAQKQFIAVLSHELRNPLAALMSTIEVLQLENRDPEMHTSLSVMHRQISTMRSLIDDLLELSRVIRDKITLRSEIIDLRVLIQESTAAARATIDQKKLTCTVSVPADPLMTYVDPVRITQVFGNILDNAIKFTPAGGSIMVHAQDCGAFAQVSIKDTGAGIRSEDAAVIFEAFVQAENATDRRGLGLGLKIAKTLTELHGGSISVSSDGEGKGSEFIVSLPLVSSDSSSVSVPPHASHLAHTHKLCLVVDDEKDVANSFGKLLQHMGQDTRVVYSAEEAMSLLETIQPDVMFIDIKMPGMDGYQFVAKVREDPRFQDTTIVAVTGYGQPDDKTRAHAVGFSMHMTKPVSLRKVMDLFGKEKMS